jgi:hypothetical protein
MDDRKIISEQREMIETLLKEKERVDDLVYTTLEENRRLQHIVEVLYMSVAVAVAVLIFR